MASSQPQDFNPAEARFFNYVNDICAHEILDPGDFDGCISSDRRVFAPRDKIQSYLEANNYWELRALLAGLKSAPVPAPSSITPRYTAVFCILLQSGRGSYIRYFTSYGSLRDTALPFDPRTRPAHWPSTPSDPNFYEVFCDAQWKFCAPELEAPVSDQHFEDERILPITFKQKLLDGGTAHLWLVHLHPSYNKLITENRKQASQLLHKIMGEENANKFVIKEYSTADAQKLYDNETSAFIQLGQHSNIISYYGSFRRGNTFNLILEYADRGTLREYFEKQLPPTLGEDIIRFWKSLFKLIGALWEVHTKGGEAADGRQILKGWHQDVKPENILVLSNGERRSQDWQFKLADLGSSHFKKIQSSREDSMASDTYGTHTYGAPETSRLDETANRNKLRVNQNIDIWSLGCVYSEAVRWLADNQIGIHQYQRERKAETGETTRYGSVDCFHDGFKPLEAVRRSHETSLNRIQSLRRPDFITDAVVHMIQDMLVETKDRPTAETLWRKQGRIVDAAAKKLQEYTLSTQASNSLLYPKQGNQLRAATDPVPGPFSASAPALPLVLPPGYRRKPLLGSPENRLPSLHEHVLSNTTTNGVLGDSIPRHHSPDSIGREIGSQNTTPVKVQSSPVLFQGTSPLTPPFSPTHRSVSNHISVHPDKDPFLAPLPGTTIASPQYPRSSSPSSARASGIYNTGHLGIGRSESARLGRAGQRTSLINPGAHITENPGRERPSSGNEYQEDAAGRVPRREISHASSSNRPIAPANGYVEGTHPFMPTSLPIRQDTVPLEHQSLPHRPALAPSSSDFKDLSFVLDWKRECKSTRVYKSCLTQRHQDRLKDRDHVFLIDDSYSMVDHWPNVVKLFEGLSYILKDTDRNGLDVYFTISQECALQNKHTKDMVPMVKRRKQRDPTARTEINYRLTKILDEYKAKLDSNKFWKSKPKPLSLYILTNGVWEKECQPEIPIKNVVRKLQDLRKDREQIGIQFISFGNDEIGLERLRYLDDELTGELEHDIVDTTPWDGNILKMLFGHINEDMDRQDAANTGASST
ncbi:hypothetical protein VTL71DRAFT_7769 [Oculimacula yallundae]|uniref:Protein kinase domain-containing protein n=1 Tax=Oculimacula yallundae TaxID=86028 RepID=A0ABR4CVM3_9HELO